MCAGLVKIDPESNIARLVHFTTRTYFENTHQKYFPEARTNLAASCLSYLSSQAFDGHYFSDEELAAQTKEYPLLDYAAKNWGIHAREVQNDVQDLTLKFLRNETSQVQSV